MLRTKIVCTIGQASRDPATLAALIRAGMDVARLNMSHGDLDFHRENIRRIRQLAEELDKPVAILADLQGPKLRVGTMPPGGVPLAAGEMLVLTTEPIIGGPGRVPVQYEHLPEAVKAGGLCSWLASGRARATRLPRRSRRVAVSYYSPLEPSSPR